MFVTNTNNIPRGASVVNSADVPGLGFSYADFFALHPNQRVIGFPNRNGAFRGFAFFSPYGLYGYPGYYSDDTSAADQSQAQTQPDYEQPQQQQPQVVYVLPPGYQAVPGGNAPGMPGPAQPPTSDAPSGPNEYVLMRRDGTVLLANAFTVESGQVTYITPEGGRHKVDLSDLDVDATRKMNEERGTNISLPSVSSSRTN